MPAKPKNKTIAAAEKRTIKAEINCLERHRKGIFRAFKAMVAKDKKEIARINKLRERDTRKLLRDEKRITRRIAILEGRLLS